MRDTSWGTLVPDARRSGPRDSSWGGVTVRDSSWGGLTDSSWGGYTRDSSWN